MTRAEALRIVQANAPYRTGTLRNSFKVVEYEDGFGIMTDIPYMKFTTEKWAFNKRWNKTLQNPNEQWFQRTAFYIAQIIAQEKGGVVNVIK